MSHIAFNELMAEAERGAYAVGYFECWNLESVQAVMDAAEAVRAPVIIGFSGIYLPHPDRVVKERLRLYAALGTEAIRQVTVPACLLFNESSHLDWVMDAVQLGFDLVMFTDESLSCTELAGQVRTVTAAAHKRGIAVEAELIPLPGVGGHGNSIPDDLRLSDPVEARSFVEQTGIDALAVNVGQVHVHGRQHMRLDLARIAVLRQAMAVPLVLHGASSVCENDLAQAPRLGVRKINVGSILKQAFFEAMARNCAEVGAHYNPYEVVGSGLAGDVLAAGRLAMQDVVMRLMVLFGSAGKA
jgi:fructose/tagatose bisphosphate aldolase